MSQKQRLGVHAEERLKAKEHNFWETHRGKRQRCRHLRYGELECKAEQEMGQQGVPDLWQGRAETLLTGPSALRLAFEPFIGVGCGSRGRGTLLSEWRAGSPGAREEAKRVFWEENGCQWL